MKSNLGVMPDSLAYRLVDSPEHGVAQIVWEGTTDHSAHGLLAGPSADDSDDRKGIDAWLTQLLANGSVKATEVYSAADAAGTIEEGVIGSTGLSAADAGTGSETGTPGAAHTLADAGTLAEATAPGYGLAEFGVAVEVGAVVAGVAAADTSAASDAGTPAAQLSAAEAGTLAEAGTPGAAHTLAETGTLADAIRPEWAAAEAGTLAEVGTPGAALLSAETGTGTDAGTPGAAVLSADAGTLAETALPGAAHTLAEAGTLAEAVVPNPGPADHATGADAVCPVIPLKDRRGLTSTGVMLPGSMGRTRRLTLREAHALPTVFGVSEARAGLAIDDPFAVLLINTGLLVVRLDRPWVERFPGFQNGYDGVHRGPDGRWRAGCFSEDWTFSAWCAGNGVKTLATTAVRCVHHGHDGDYPNGPAWGDCDTDPGED